MAACHRRQGDDLLIDVRLTPKSSRDGVDGAATLSDGRCVLAVRVRAVPEDGKANAALESVLAKALRLPRSMIRLESGHSSRLKTVRLAGAGAEVEALIDDLATG